MKAVRWHGFLGSSRGKLLHLPFPRLQRFLGRNPREPWRGSAAKARAEGQAAGQLFISRSNLLSGVLGGENGFGRKLLVKTVEKLLVRPAGRSSKKDPRAGGMFLGDAKENERNVLHDMQCR